MDRLFGNGDTSVESALQATELRHAVLFQNAPAAMIAFEVESLDILAVNETAIAQYGYSREEFLGLTMRDLRPATDVAPFWRAHNAMRAGHEIHGVYRHRHRDGRLLDVELRTSTLPVGSGNVRLLLALDDTTRQRRADVASYLDGATSILASSLELSFVCRNLATLAVPRLGEWCAVHLVDRDGTLESYGFAHADPLRQLLVADLLDQRGALPTSHPARVAQRGAIVVECDGPTAAGDVAGPAGALVSSLDIVSARYIPVLGRGRVLAVIECVADSAHAQPASTTALGTALAERAALALDNAMSHAELRQKLLDATQPAADSSMTEETDLASWVFETIPTCFLRVDHNWALTYVNGEAERTLGRPREELVGQDFWTVFPETIGSAFEVAYRGAMRDQRTVTVEEFYPPLDAWFEGSAKPSGRGLAIFFQDVTRHHRTRTLLAEGEAAFRDFVESATDLIYMLSADGRILYANRAWREALGYTDAEARALTITDIVAPESLEVARAALSDAVQRTASRDTELTVLRKDGSRLVVRGRSNWRTVDGVPVSNRGIFRDVTLEVQARELLAHAQRTESAAARAKSAFLDRMSHEMRTPLTAVIGFAGILEQNRGGRLSPMELRFAERIGVQGRNLLALIEDVLAYADIESRRVDLRVSSVELRAHLHEVVEVYRADAARAKVDVVLELPALPVLLETDGATLRRVMRYLLNHAIECVPGGQLRVTLAADGGGVAPTITLTTVARGARPNAAPTGVFAQAPELGLSIAESLAEVLGVRLSFGAAVDGVTTTVLSLDGEASRPPAAVDNSAKTLHAILEASPLPIIAFQPDWTVRLWNAAAHELYGWAPHEAIERRLPMLREEDDVDFRELLRQALAASHGIADVPAQHRRRDGSLVTVRVSVAPLRSADGRLRGFLCIATDVSERTRLEEELRQAQRMEIVGRLAGGIAHDFNNLLTVMSAHAQFMLDDLPPGDQLVDDARAIQESAERAAALTRQLLLFARKQVPQRRTVDLNRKVANVDRILRRTLGSHIEYITIPSPSDVRVHADPGQVEQVIMNLVLNARDAMPAGGALTVQVEAREASGGPEAVITVSDTGTGMDEATRAQIFEPFFTTKGPDRGTGLGLATVQSIVTESGGRVEVESAVGEGTTFRVLLPALTGPAAAEPGAAHDRESLVGRGTVLLVEDQDAVRTVAARALTAYGYTVLAARHGRDALAILASGQPVDLLLTDLVMPEMHGQELAERVEAICPGIPVLFMSGYDEAPQRTAPLDEGTPLLRKPFTGEALARAVGRRLKGVNREL